MSTRQYDSATDLITFSRASGGTALRKVAYGSELVTNGTFDSDTSGWSVVGGGSISSAGGRLRITSDGTLTRAQQSFATVVGKTYKIAFSAYKGTANNYLFYAGSSTAANNYVNQSAPDGSFEKTFVATGTSCWITVYCGTSGSGLYSEYDNISVKEVLFDQGDLTLFNHPADIPRIEYDADGNVLGLLVEESRTNLLTYSEDFSNAAWVISTSGTGSVTKSTANAAASPDGALTADRIIFDLNGGETTGDLALLRQANSATGSLTQSVYLRSFDGVSSYTMQLILPDGNGENITVTGSWQRFEVSGTSVGGVNYGVRLRGGQLPANSDYADVLIWGAQLEAGAFPTSYIKTSGATATRAADVASIPVSAFGYNQSEGTVVVDINTPLPTGEINYAFALDDGTTSNMAIIFRDASDTLVASTVSSGTNQGNLTLKTSALGNNKVAYVLSTNDSAAVCTGESVLTDTTYSVPTVTDLVIGDRGAGSRELNGHIKSIKYFPRRLTNSQLVEITT